MKYYNITDEPIKIYGLNYVNEKDKKFWKIPIDIMNKMPESYQILGKRPIGGRARFMTNSKNISIKLTLARAKVDVNISLSCSAGADIYTGTGTSSKFIGYISPKEYSDSEITIEKSFEKSNEMETVTINFPRNEELKGMVIGIDDDATITESEQYTYKKPIVFYGSSITEGGCASRVGNTYTSILSRWLDSDYMNMGFSGSAKGEIEFANYINSIDDIGMFVYDYDHNAPNSNHLKETHELFFSVIRNKHPKLPIVIMSKPDTDKDLEDSIKRRSIIYNTYINAVNNGDSKVWFVDGGQFFGMIGRDECTVDGTHPNDLGFMRMAEKLYPLFKQILEV